MEKKNSLFKAVMLMIFVTLVLTWIIPVSSYDGTTITKGEITPTAIFDVFVLFINTAVIYMGYFAVYILCVGGFYGVLKRTKGYQKAIEGIANKFKGHEKRFLVISAILFALTSSLTGMSIELFAFIPFVISTIIVLGYDKLTAVLTTAGAIIVGMIGSTFGTMINGNIDQALNITANSELISKFFLLIMGTILLVMYLTKNAKLQNKKDKKEEVKDVYYEKESNNKKSPVTVYVILGLIFVLLILMLVPWSTLFGTKMFTDFHTMLMDVKILDFPIFANIFGQLPAFGNWNLMYIGIVFVIASALIAFIYSLKANDAIDGFMEGAKKVAMPAFLLVLANMVMIIVNNASQGSINTIVITMMNGVTSLTSDFNLFLSTISATIGSIFVPSMQYLAGWHLPMFVTTYGNVNLYPLIGLIFQSMYGLVMLVLPVSSVLILGLSYLDVKYTAWIKYIWKFLLQLLVVIIATLLIVWLI